MSEEDAPMNQITSYTPAALYARVSSDRQVNDVNHSGRSDSSSVRRFCAALVL